MRYPPIPQQQPPEDDLATELGMGAVVEVPTVLAPIDGALTMAAADAMFADLQAQDPQLAAAFVDAPWEDLGGSWRRSIKDFTFTASRVGYQVRVDE